MKTQFMLIALSLIAVMAIPGAFAETIDSVFDWSTTMPITMPTTISATYDIDLIIGTGDHKRNLTGTFSVGERGEWRGEFTVDGKNSETVNIRAGEFIPESQDSILQFYGEVEHSPIRVLSLNVTSTMDGYDVTGGSLKIIQKQGSDMGKIIKDFPIRNGTMTIVDEVKPVNFSGTWNIRPDLTSKCGTDDATFTYEIRDLILRNGVDGIYNLVLPVHGLIPFDITVNDVTIPTDSTPMTVSFVERNVNGTLIITNVDDNKFSMDVDIDNLPQNCLDIDESVTLVRK